MNIRDIITQTCVKCGVPELTHKIKYEFNRRFTARLGDATWKPMQNIGVVRFSLPLWERASETEKYETIVHEVCHIIANSQARATGYINQPHGPEWKRLMIICGVAPESCHTVNRDGLARKLPRVQATCGCMTHNITTNRATRMSKGKKYKCLKCNNLIALVKG